MLLPSDEAGSRMMCEGSVTESSLNFLDGKGSQPILPSCWRGLGAFSPQGGCILHIRRNVVMPSKSNRKNSTPITQHTPVKATGISVSVEQWALKLSSLGMMEIVCLRGPWLESQSPPWCSTALPCQDYPWGKVLLHLNETWLAHYLFRQTQSTNDSSFPYFVLPVRQPSAFTSQLIIKGVELMQQFQPCPLWVTTGNLQSSPKFSTLTSSLWIFKEKIFWELYVSRHFLPGTFSLFSGIFGLPVLILTFLGK